MRASLVLAPFAALAFAALPLAAQNGTAVVTAATAVPAPAVPDSVYLRAQRLVSEGNGPDGRAIVDSLLTTLRPGSDDYAEALYWKAALAATAAEAERTYLRLTIDYPLSPRAGASLMRLAQLELARGDRAAARGRLYRLTVEYRDGPLYPRAQYWLARSYFEEEKLPEGCASLDGALGAVSEDDVELRNQLNYYTSRCVNVTRRPPRFDDPEPARRPARATPPRRAAVLPSAPPKAAAATPAAPAAAPGAAPASPAVTPAPAAPAAQAAFTVQVAAFEDAASARTYVAQLGKSGVSAYVVNVGPWHRVRVGRFVTRAEAEAAAKRLEGQGVKGFVVGVAAR
ncbi:MAG TPA: SPOR domain-containing protein [Gemmatimonadaceae bacterium]|jgi:cell division septation protein DedD|nr:SPOR domain-containing protein [Gemmatimonadaceae bacterium]